MSFASLTYFVFLLVTFSIYWKLTSFTLQKRWLLLASLVFYGWFDYRLLALLIGSCIFNFVVAREIRLAPLQNRKPWLVLTLVVNVLILALFKYFDFFLESANRTFIFFGSSAHFNLWHLVLPIGISFYTFQNLSFVIDVYWGKLEELPSLEDYTLSIVFFPQLVAGPILRASDFLPQLRTQKDLRHIDFRFAITTFALGFTKKLVIADALGPIIDPVFQSPREWDTLSLWAASIGHAIQLYCDFSGYSDMAMGAAALFGFRLCINFKAPFLSRNLEEFWNRWHISLSSWLSDYIYKPLGGSRGSQWRTVFNVMVTFILGGIWHGAALKYIVFGAIHGVTLAALKCWNFKSPQMKLPQSLAVGFTFISFCVYAVIFRSPSLTLGVANVKGMFLGQNGEQIVNLDLFYLLFGVLAALHYYKNRNRAQWAQFIRRLNSDQFALATGAAWALIVFFTHNALRPFIYFQF